MKKLDIIASLILGEIFAIFLGFVLRGLGFSLFPIYILYFILPVLALIGVWTFYLIGKKIPIAFQFGKYAVTGFANTAVDFGVLNLLMWMTSVYSGKSIFLLNSISFLIAVIHSYFWNKFWAFKSKDKNIAGQFLQFVVISLVAVLINGAIVYTISSLVSPMFNLSIEAWANIAKALATVVSLIWNFLGYKFIVFKKK
ncbi:MAG: GtrA family protein [Patescibacteria group bacterium]